MERDVTAAVAARRFHRVAIAIVVMAAAVSSSACLVTSLQPFYDPDAVATVTFDPALLGVWDSAEDGVSVTIEAGEWSSYRIAFTERTGTEQFTGHATRIGDRQFLEVLPAHGYERSELFVPLHVVFLVSVDGNTLTSRPLSYLWFAQAAKAGRLREVGAVFDAKRNVVMTASSASVRSFLKRQRADEMFGPPATLERRTSKRESIP
jgi:hypothetical protein